jgi:Zn-dependent M28 family amino/carboxypeptidase
MTSRRLALLLVGLPIAALCAQPALHFDGARAFEDLRQMVLIGPRPSGSPQAAQTRAYLERELKAAGVAYREQAFDARTPDGTIPMANVVATIPGERKDRVAIAGHYDTKRFAAFSFVGADDGGSSAAFVLEMARALKARKNPYTIELLFLDGEEAVREWSGKDHTYGSRHYVEAARADGSLAGLKALILVDMIGDRDLTMHREGNSTPWLTDLVWAASRRLGQQRHFLDSTTFIEDDHLEFLEAGVPSVDLIDLEYPPWHTSADTLDKVSPDSLQVVGDVLLDALPHIEAHLTGRK